MGAGPPCPAIERDAAAKPRERFPGAAERVAYGVYRMKAIPPDELDEYMRAALWPMGAGAPNVFFSDGWDNGEVSDWTWSSASGWQLQNFF